jgi:hypothetical protein
MSVPDYPIFANSTQYQPVAASQSNAALGPGGGGVGDYLSHLTVIPATTSPGAVTVSDGATQPTVFTGGANSVSSLVPFTIALGARSTSGGWKITTGAGVSVVAFGQFS